MGCAVGTLRPWRRGVLGPCLEARPAHGHLPSLTGHGQVMRRHRGEACYSARSALHWRTSNHTPRTGPPHAAPARISRGREA
jgi:hypothetical protein